MFQCATQLNANQYHNTALRALRVALVNEYMLTFFKILSFKVHAADDLESSGISKPNGERDWKKECIG